MKFLVSIYQDEDGAYVAECPAIPWCVSQGRSEAEVEANISDAIRECLAARGNPADSQKPSAYQVAS